MPFHVLPFTLILACSKESDPIEAVDPWEDQSFKENCFPGGGNQDKPMPDYDQFHPIIGRSCSGTNHQAIENVEKVVYLGDSITEGTWPTPEDGFYRNVLTGLLEERFGPLEVDRCAAFGARTDDLLLAPHQQVLTCFPEVEEKTTLVVMTMGGNDLFEMSKDLVDGVSPEALEQDVTQMISLFEDAIHWFDDNGDRFPNGVHVLFSNIYEYTDATGDMDSCPTAEILGFSTQVEGMRDAYIRVNEAYVELAVESQRDVIFLLEQFCGHGFYNEDPENECYQGPDSERWFDNTCIHPTPAGHAQIAKMFFDLVIE